MENQLFFQLEREQGFILLSIAGMTFSENKQLWKGVPLHLSLDLLSRKGRDLVGSINLTSMTGMKDILAA